MNKISIIIPVYKVEPYLRECLDSVINQTYNNLEIILIDDGSPDNCGAICDEYAKMDSRIIVIHKENAGVSAARNDGLKMMTGDWFTFVDSDDWIEPDYCEKFIQFISEYQADIVFLGGVFWKNGSNNTEVRRSVKSEFVYTKENNPEKWEILLSKVLSYKITDEYLTDQFFWGTVCSIFHNTSFWKKNNIMFSTEMSRFEDGLFNLMMTEKADSIGVLPFIGYHYRKTNVESVNYRYISGRVNSLLMYIQNLYANKDITNMRLLKEAVSAVILNDLPGCLRKDYFHRENPKSKSEIRKELWELKQEPYIQQAIWQKENDLLFKSGVLLKYCLRLPGVWIIKPFYKLCELVNGIKALWHNLYNK